MRLCNNLQFAFSIFGGISYALGPRLYNDLYSTFPIVPFNIARRQQ